MHIGTNVGGVRTASIKRKTEQERCETSCAPLRVRRGSQLAFGRDAEPFPCISWRDQVVFGLRKVLTCADAELVRYGMTAGCPGCEANR